MKLLGSLCKMAMTELVRSKMGHRVRGIVPKLFFVRHGRVYQSYAKKKLWPYECATASVIQEETVQQHSHKDRKTAMCSIQVGVG